MAYRKKTTLATSRLQRSYHEKGTKQLSKTYTILKFCKNLFSCPHSLWCLITFYQLRLLFTEQCICFSVYSSMQQFWCCLFIALQLAAPDDALFQSTKSFKSNVKFRAWMKLTFLEVRDCSLKGKYMKFKLLQLSAVQGREIWFDLHFLHKTQTHHQNHKYINQKNESHTLCWHYNSIIVQREQCLHMSPQMCVYSHTKFIWNSAQMCMYSHKVHLELDITMHVFTHEVSTTVHVFTHELSTTVHVLKQGSFGTQHNCAHTHKWTQHNCACTHTWTQHNCACTNTWTQHNYACFHTQTQHTCACTHTWT